MFSRLANFDDAEAIARIYNKGIQDAIATFETRLRSGSDICAWFDGFHPVVVVEGGGEILGFGATFHYRDRECYLGIAEFSVYVARKARRQGIGRQAMEALIREAQHKGFWKLVSRVFVENTASRNLLKTLGFREVGVYRRHGKLNGVWRDVVIVEYLIAANSQ